MLTSVRQSAEKLFYCNVRKNVIIIT